MDRTGRVMRSEVNAWALQAGVTRRDPFYGYVTHLEAALPEPPSGGYSRGGHGQEYWSRVAPAEAKFIGRAFG